jgi:GTP-binding protein
VTVLRLPTVAIVGRPNVGKSTLVNRIVGRREAIVEEQPGVTRDRKELEADWRGRDFVVVDTGGWLATGDTLDAQVSRQAERAINAADVVVFVLDATVGVTDEDARVAAILRRSDRPVIVVANKVDSENRELDAWELASLGLGEPVPVSALHGRGSGDLLDRVVDALPPEPEPDGATVAGTTDEEAGIPAVAIVGRPNVGKSTLFNRLIGDDRSVVHDQPGTTRDTVDTVVETPHGPFRFVDTAGMRRKSRIDDGPEYYSLVRALQAIDRAQAALLLIDASEGVSHQDQRLAERVDGAGTAVVVVLNKWDLLDAEARERVTADVEDRLGFLGYAPVLKVSARSGKGVHRILPALADALEASGRRVPTRELNQLV